jgi:predicted 2-oxoglutarate/Fe(II)-dependent dioxygenase YbiX
MAYLNVPGLLKPMELDMIDRLIAAANFEDGAGTATDAAKMVKKNLQMPKTGSREKQQIDGIVMHAIAQSPLIQAALMPIRVLPPIISKYVHGVMPVTSGTRLAAVTWMQCAVRDIQQREILFHLKSVQTLTEQQNPHSQENLVLLQIYSNLIRMWAEQRID